MTVDRRRFLATGAALVALPAAARGAAVTLSVTTPMVAPRWATLQRGVLAANMAACEAFYAKYVDDRGWLRVFARWGANDGPDDAAEATNDWALLHALGAPDRIRTLYHKVWEGHLKQYTAARTVEVPAGKQGMYFKEFSAQMDWQHQSEGLTVFNVMGLGDPYNKKYRDRVRTFANFYTGHDPAVRNYDPKLRITRSLMNGSRGPMLGRATELDWAGDPFEAGARFHMDHGETTYQQTLDHYAEYGDVVGDNPLNLQSTTLGLNAYALGAGDRYRTWALDYLDAWVQRARANGDILPSRVGVDGVVPRDWWSGVYGWNFSPVVPQTGKRENRNRVPRSITAFMNGTLLSGDGAYIDVWRRQNARINDAAKSVDGVASTPTMHGPDGWYGWQPGSYRTNGFEIWYVSQSAADRQLAGDHPWLDFLDGRNPDYPVTALNQATASIDKRLAAIRADPTTPETRLADWPLNHNPASVAALVQLMTGGLHIARPPWSKTSPNQGGVPLHCRLRYFDPAARRAGVPDGVAALVHSLGDTATQVTLVNLASVERTVTVQGGAYAEHRIDSVTLDGKTSGVGAAAFTVRLAPGCGARLTLAMQRYANRPKLAFPWDR